MRFQLAPSDNVQCTIACFQRVLQRAYQGHYSALTEDTIARLSRALQCAYQGHYSALTKGTMARLPRALQRSYQGTLARLPSALQRAYDETEILSFGSGPQAGWLGVQVTSVRFRSRHPARVFLKLPFFQNFESDQQGFRYTVLYL